MSLELWLAYVLTSAVLLVIPGPTILTVISYSLTHGRRANLPLVAGVALGDTALAIRRVERGLCRHTAARIGFVRERGMIEGACLCGGIRYQYDGEIEEISICHCSQCRKAQGSAFAAVSPVAADRLRIVAGTELLKEYRSSADKVRVFCSRCGSPIYSAKDDTPEVRRLRLGTVETPFVCASAFHIFTGSKASWWDCDDGLPRYAQRRP